MNERYDLVIDSRRAITPDGEIACTVGVRDETVIAVMDFGADPGRVRSTWLRGTDISADVENNGDRFGRLLRRGEA